MSTVEELVREFTDAADTYVRTFWDGGKVFERAWYRYKVAGYELRKLGKEGEDVLWQLADSENLCVRGCALDICRHLDCSRAYPKIHEMYRMRNKQRDGSMERTACGSVVGMLVRNVKPEWDDYPKWLRGENWHGLDL